MFTMMAAIIIHRWWLASSSHSKVIQATIANDVHDSWREIGWQAHIHVPSERHYWSIIIIIIIIIMMFNCHRFDGRPLEVVKRPSTAIQSTRKKVTLRIPNSYSRESGVKGWGMESNWEGSKDNHSVWERISMCRRLKLNDRKIAISVGERLFIPIDFTWICGNFQGFHSSLPLPLPSPFERLLIIINI